MTGRARLRPGVCTLLICALLLVACSATSPQAGGASGAGFGGEADVPTSVAQDGAPSGTASVRATVESVTPEAQGTVEVEGTIAVEVEGTIAVEVEGTIAVETAVAEATTTITDAPVTASMRELKLQGELYAAEGDPNAPLTIVEFSDYG